MAKSRRVIRRIKPAGDAAFDEQFWPVILAVFVLGGFLMGTVLAYLDFEDPRWYAKAWIWMFAIPIVLCTSEREAGKLYANVRWLNLAAAITPLMGLLGTVWGMIRAFHDTTQLSPGQNKADYLAEGIYVALITTLGGLMVAIPAAIFAHYFEGRIQSLFLQIDEMLFSLMPQIERFEGKVRFGQQ